MKAYLITPLLTKSSSNDIAKKQKNEFGNNQLLTNYS